MTAVLLDLYGSEILSNTVPAGVIVPQKGSATVTQPLTGGNWTVDNHGSQLYLGVIATDAFSFLGATVSFRLQVSPATYPPTFGDVPTYDVGYQYIEALAASGITGGCGNGNFCPDAAVTRRQMAVFLAKALGLQWP